MERGELVDDALICQVMGARLGEPDAAGGFILDGFPRTAPQAGALDALLGRLGLGLTGALLLDVGDEQVGRAAVGATHLPGVRARLPHRVQPAPAGRALRPRRHAAGPARRRPPRHHRQPPEPSTTASQQQADRGERQDTLPAPSARSSGSCASASGAWRRSATSSSAPWLSSRGRPRPGDRLCWFMQSGSASRRPLTDYRYDARIRSGTVCTRQSFGRPSSPRRRDRTRSTSAFSSL
jgi:adenylate kinase family enzyme